jgi:uncharacterized protein
VVETIAADLGCTVSVLMADAGRRSNIDITRYVSPALGMPTLQDILKELAKPGRDPRRNSSCLHLPKA